MWETIKTLASSRKIWVGGLTVVTIAGGILLVALGKLESSMLLPITTALTALGVTTIGSIAWEDAAQSKNNANREIGKAIIRSVSNFPRPLPSEESSDDTKP